MQTNPLFSELETRLSAVCDKNNLTGPERENLWTMAVQTYHAALLTGQKSGRAKKTVSTWLWANVPALGESANAIFFQLYRKLKTIAKGGNLADKRRVAGVARRAPMLSYDDRKALVQAAVIDCGNQLNLAWRLCLRKKRFSPEVLERYNVPKTRHADCPKSIRRQVSMEVEQLWAYHVGPHKTKNSIAPMERDWSNVYVQDRYEIDDKTLDVRCRFQYHDGGEIKEKIIRPQMLLVIDSKSGKALGKVLIAENNYNSLAAKTLCRQVFQATGLPAAFLMECGIWKRAKLLGKNPTSKSFVEVENFCSRVGVALSHALPGRARSKTIEGKFRLIDKFMFNLPGYIGRDEMHVRYERVKGGELLTFDELDSQLDARLDEYNDTAQDSKIMGGFFTPNQIWEKSRRLTAGGTPQPVTFMPPQFEYLLTNHVETAKVTLNGVRFTVAGETYQYYGEDLVDFHRGYMGQSVKVWFDPDAPKTAVVSDLKGIEFFPARRVPKAPAMAVTPADWEQFREAVQPHRNAVRQLRERYSIIKLGYVPPARTNVADIETINRAQKMADAKEKAEEKFERIETEDYKAKQERTDIERRRRAWELYDLRVLTAHRFDEPEKHVPPNFPRPSELPATRAQSAAVVSEFVHAR